ncbi:O-fucosyltransferase family protein [Lunatibacter salilacus]|uniref:hypothetical protein n=1 Tax=Lunatibacter salilacus TaxID=2483804 RepID=UPI00131E3B37|nr:hypothetical protein [Lunatibacter salilacus]
MSVGSKRSVISRERLEELSQPNIVYVITCFQRDFFCDGHFDGNCWRGFFSLYLQVAYGIYFAKKNGLPHKVDFGNLDYFYSDETKFEGNRNFWEYYFEIDPPNSSLREVINSKYENYPLRIWDRKFFKKFHIAVSLDFRLRDEISKAIQNATIQFSGNTILGIHVRRTDHYQEIAPVKLSSLYKLINRRVNAFDKLFVATDDEEVLKTLKKAYKEKVIYHSSLRSSGKAPIHGVQNKANGYLLGKEALIDCHSLALCDELILSPSNLSYCALIINPNIPFRIAESWESKVDRWKTLAAYYLNEWGLRKW